MRPAFRLTHRGFLAGVSAAVGMTPFTRATALRSAALLAQNSTPRSSSWNVKDLGAPPDRSPSSDRILLSANNLAGVTQPFECVEGAKETAVTSRLST